MPAQDVNLLYNDQVARQWANRIAEAFKDGGNGYGKAAESIGKAMEDAAESTEDVSKAQKESLKALTKFIRATEKVAKGERQKTKLTSAQIKQLKILGKHSHQAGDKFSGMAKEFVSGKLSYEDARKEIDKLSGAATTSTKAFDRMKGGLKDFGRKLLDPRLIAAEAGLAVQAMGDFKAAMQFGTDVSRGLFSNMTDALWLGIDPSTLSEIQASNRQAIHAFGGIGKWAARLETAEEEMFDFIGDHTEATKFVASQLTTLGMVGIKPTMEEFKKAGGAQQSLFETFQQLQKSVGMTFAESGQMLRELAQDENIRFKLTGAIDDKQRAIMLKNIAARQAEFVALGMTIDQAKRASAALETIAGVSPRERMKRGA
ncbi:hypothetical protein LCGC14_1261930, partial [marine sediment metagenome]